MTDNVSAFGTKGKRTNEDTPASIWALQKRDAGLEIGTFRIAGDKGPALPRKSLAIRHGTIDVTIGENV